MISEIRIEKKPWQPKVDAQGRALVYCERCLWDFVEFDDADNVDEPLQSVVIFRGHSLCLEHHRLEREL